LGQRSRKRGQRGKPPVVAEPLPSRSEQRNQSVRATLTPLGPSERPWPLLVAVVLALLVGGVQLVLFLAGVKIASAGSHIKAGPTFVFAGLMFVCAAGMWAKRYWALLGFMTLLALFTVVFAIDLIRASSLRGFAVAIAGLCLSGYLFYKLVRVLSRVQMPQPPGR
jgi:hypothetical protein